MDINTSGFYNKDSMLRAGKFVYGPDFTLLAEDKDLYTYPVNGWYWFDTAMVAALVFSVNVEDFNLDLPASPTE